MATALNDATPVALLRAEWTRLAADPRTDTVVTRWARQTPDLAPLADGLASLPTVTGAADHADRDRLLLALLQRAQSPGHEGELATRLIIQLMLPRTVAVARRLPDACGSTADRQQITITSLVDTIRCFPLDGTVEKVTGYLAAWMWRRAVRRAAQDRRTELLVATGGLDNGDIEALVDHAYESLGLEATAQIALDPTGNASEQMVRLLAWAVDTGALDTDSARLLAHRCSYEGHYRSGGASSTAALAHRLGVSEATVRQRLSRAQRRLTDAVSEAMAA